MISHLPISSGQGGETFFVLSAFFVTRKHLDDNNFSVNNQSLKRIIRLYPPYITVLVVSVLFALLMREIPFDLATHIFSAQNFHWMVTDYSSPMQSMTAHTWTLSIEVWVGLLWLVFLRYLSKKQFKFAMYIVIIVAVIYRTMAIYIGFNAWLISLCPVAHMDAFAFGALLSIEMNKEKVNLRNIVFQGAVGIICCTLCISTVATMNNISWIDAYQLFSSSKNYLNNWFTGNVYMFISMISCLLISLLYLWDDRHNVTNPEKRVKRCMVKLGDNSYTLYLFRWLILFILRRICNIWYVFLPFTIVATIIFNMIALPKSYFIRRKG